IGAQSFPNDRPIRVEIKDGADSLDDEKQRTRVAKQNARDEGVILLVKRTFDLTVPAVQRNRAAITRGLDRFDTGSCPGRQIFEDTLPIVGRTKVEAEKILILRPGWGDMRQSPNLCGCPVVHLVDRSIEWSHRAKPGSDCDLAHGQQRLVDELLGKMQAPRMRYGTWSGPQMAKK